MKRTLPALLLLLSLLAACANPGDPANSNSDLSPLERAGRAFETGELDLARAALEEHLDDEPDDPRGRYLLARTLAGMGELRGARSELMRAVELDGENPLHWSLLARLHEQLGEHPQALQAYGELMRRVPESREPVRGIARCQLFLGRPEAALAMLSTGNEDRPPDLASDYLAFQALRRLQRDSQAEDSARSFLDQAKDEPLYADRALEVRRWLSSQSDRLEPSVRQAMVDYVRAACRLKLPGAAAAEEAVLESAPERLFVFDDRPVFLTLLTPEGGPRFRGRGRGNSLAAALKGAVAEAQAAANYAPLLVRQAAVRVEVGRQLQPVDVQQQQGRLILNPPLERGEHGVTLRADGREVYALPGDPLVEDLVDLPQVLAFAAESGGLAPDAWYGNTRAVYVFQTEAFVSPTPGASPRDLQAGEPLPLPRLTPSVLAGAIEEGAGWLTTLLRADGGCAPGYQPRQDLHPEGELDLVTEARLAAALARLWEPRGPGAHGSDVLLAASRHLIERVSVRLADGAEAAHAAQAWLLVALHALGDRAAADEAGLSARRLAEQVAAGSDAPHVAAWALWQYASRAPEPEPWRVEAARLWPLADALASADPLARDALRLAAESGHPEAQAALQAWAYARLEPSAPPLSVDELAVFARLAQAYGEAQQGNVRAGELRELARLQAERLLARQLAERHRWLLPAPSRALGGFRADMTHLQLDPLDTIQALEALLACQQLLGG